uniref:Uncharacterized protein n=1 Tax=Anguilla anguilla TaxID=7936 RepID=A0A0E9XFW4_ANGAN
MFHLDVTRVILWSLPPLYLRSVNTSNICCPC